MYWALMCCAYALRLCTYTQPAQLFGAGEQLSAHTQPALRTGLMAPEKCLLAHLRTYTQRKQLFSAESALPFHLQPALRTGLMAPAWRFALYIWGGIPDLT